MLVFHSHCQLGNQMFIYACAHSLAKKRNDSYCLSELGDLHYFALSTEDYQWNKWKFFLFKIKNKLKSFQFFHYQDNREDYVQQMLENPNRNSWYYGYFQGEQYFYDNAVEVKSRFQVKEEHRIKFQEIKQKQIDDQPYAIVHIRLNDYKTFGPDYLGGPDLSLPFSYYHNLIEKQVAEDMPIVFLSDNIEAVKKEFAYLKKAYFSNNSVIADMQFILNASICILSCSTFSWWGAWLNDNSNKSIFVPENFLGFKVNKEYPVNVIPDSWKKIKV